MEQFFKKHRGFIVIILMTISIILPFVIVNLLKVVIQTDNGILIISFAGATVLIELLSVIMFFANFFLWLIERYNGNAKKK